jgi:hypothetical protein
MQQMDLPQVRLRRVPRHAGAVLDRPAEMSVALHAQAGQQADPHSGLLAEPVAAGLADGFDAT